jgi:hypothetical protein
MHNSAEGYTCNQGSPHGQLHVHVHVTKDSKLECISILGWGRNEMISLQFLCTHTVKLSLHSNTSQLQDLQVIKEALMDSKEAHASYMYTYMYTFTSPGWGQKMHIL